MVINTKIVSIRGSNEDFMNLIAKCNMRSWVTWLLRFRKNLNVKPPWSYVSLYEVLFCFLFNEFVIYILQMYTVTRFWMSVVIASDKCRQNLESLNCLLHSNIQRKLETFKRPRRSQRTQACAGRHQLLIWTHCSKQNLSCLHQQHHQRHEINFIGKIFSSGETI